MRACRLDELVKATGGQIISKSKENFTGIGTDTRKDLSGQLFWALKGETHDAHAYLEKAVSQGAAGLVVDQEPPKELIGKVTILRVTDTLRGLQDYANFVRHQFKAKVLGITGSNGKTTSKEFAQQILGSTYKVHSNKGSFNNHFGLPFNLLGASDSSEIVLAEMGMNHAGELTRLCEIAEPDVVVCTMVGRGHIEHFGSVEKIAEAKEEIYQSAPTTATRIYNLDNPWTRKMWEKASREYPQAKILTFSNSEKADVTLKLKSMSMESLTIDGQIQGVTDTQTVPVFGAQNITNLAVAAALGLAVGMTPQQVWKALPLARTSWGRNQFLETKNGGRILFDAYNANPDSMKALLENAGILSSPGKKIGVFGEMLELGDVAEQAHRELGEQVGRSNLDVVYFYGPHAQAFEQGIKSSGFSKKSFVSNTYEESVASAVAAMLKTGDLALVKGSRGMKLERFVQLCEPLNFETK